jgi:hypothetical protein
MTNVSPPAGAHAHRVSFPWEPSVQRPHEGLNAAGLHSAFAHHHIETSAVDTNAEADPSTDAGFPRTRTSSTGQGPDVGAYRRKVGFETFDKSTVSWW